MYRAKSVLFTGASGKASLKEYSVDGPVNMWAGMWEERCGQEVRVQRPRSSTVLGHSRLRKGSRKTGRMLGAEATDSEHLVMGKLGARGDVSRMPKVRFVASCQLLNT